MKKIFSSSIILCFIFLFTVNALAQFTGGNASGYCSATSVTQQLNPMFYDDLQISTITQPANNQTLNINTNYNLAFNVNNWGIYPILPADSIFFSVTLNSILQIDSFLIVTDTLHPDSSKNFLLTNILNFSDSISNVQLCVTINGSSFAADTITANNTVCHTISIIDPSSVDFLDKEQIVMYYNPDSKCIVLKNTPSVNNIFVYDILGKEIPYGLSKINDSELLIYLTENNNKIVFLKVISDKKITTKKLFIH